MYIRDLVLHLILGTLFALLFVIVGLSSPAMADNVVILTTDPSCVKSDDLKALIIDRKMNLQYIRSMTKPELKLFEDRLNRDLSISQPEKEWNIVLPSIDLYRADGIKIVAMVFGESGCYVYAFTPDPKYNLQ